jgi:adenosylhomocysteine nucleosidase
MIAIVFALEFESAGFRAVLKNRMCASVWTLGVMGRRVEPALEQMIQRNRPELIVSAGFSGALQPGIPIGTLVLGENFTDRDLARNFPIPDGFRVGRVVTADEILETSAQKMELGSQSGALAVDLESEYLHAVCSRNGVPMVSIRCITDRMEQDLPVPGHVFMDVETGRSDPGAIFRYLFRHPSAAPEFARLVRNARIAQRSLADGLNEILPFFLKRPVEGIR